MEKEVNSYNTLREKLAYINGYLKSIAVLNTSSGNIMESWMLDLGLIDEGVTHTIGKAINAPKSILQATEISDWQKFLEDDLYYFFSNSLENIQSKEEYYANTERRYDLTQKYRLDAQLKYFVGMLDNVVSGIMLKTVYNIEIDVHAEWDCPYFAHSETNVAFEIQSNQLLYLHMSAYD